MKLALRSIVVSCALVFAAIPAHATPIDVRVLSATHSVTLTASDLGVPKAAKTSTESEPVSESLSWVGCGEPYCPEIHLFGTADLLDVSAEVYRFLADGTAHADSEWTFSPLVDGIADIQLLGTASFSESTFSASLFDLTANEEVWQFLRYDSPDCCYAELSTFLLADHVYAMHLNAFARSELGVSYSTLSVSGIQAVPDNADTLLCICIGLLVVLLGQWKLPT